MTPHTLRLTIPFAALLLACSGKEPSDTGATGTSPQDTDQRNIDTGAEELPDRLPFAGTLSATVGDTSCTGPAEAVIIGALNIAGNAECVGEDGLIIYATISGSRAEDGSASGTVAILDSSAPWQGAADATTLSGTFKDPNTEGSFALKAAPEK